MHGPYAFVWENYGQYFVQQFPILQNQIFAWWFMFIGVEFAYYCK